MSPINLPLGWEMRNLRQLHAGDVGTVNPAEHPDEEFEYYSIPAYQGDMTPVVARGAEILSQKLLIPPDCLLFGKLNPRVEKVWNVRSRGTRRRLASTEWLPIVPTQDLDQEFGYFLLWSEWVLPLAKQLVSGSTPSRQRVEPSAFYDIEVPVPPLEEQRRIAAQLSFLNRAVQVQDKAVQATALLKQAASRALFTRGLRGEAQKETQIGLVPESWTIRSISDLCEIWSGGTPRKSVAQYWKGDFPWVSGKDLKKPRLDDAIDHVTAEAVEVGSCLAPENAVLVLVRGMGLAKDLPIAVITRPMAFNQDIKALVSRGEFSGAFLQSAIYSGKQRLLSRIVPSAHGTMTLNLDDIESFLVPCPSDRDEAQEITGILDILDRKIELHLRKREVLHDLFKTLLRMLMTAETRVADLDLSALDSERIPEVVR